MESNGDSQPLTRSMKKKLNIADEVIEVTDHPEVEKLVQDQLFHNFVEKIVDPDQGPIKDDEEGEDFVPGESSILEAEDGGSSEEELDKEEEEENDANEDLELSIDGKPIDVVKGVPPAMAQAYKKRFPQFWRTQHGLTIHTGQSYDQEEDPDFEAQDSSDDEDSDSEEAESENKDQSQDEIKEEEIDALAVQVEDMIIPDEQLNLEANADLEEKHEDSSDEEEKNVAQVIEEILDGYKSEEDPEFLLTPDDLAENDDTMSDDSYESAVDDHDTDEEDDTKEDEDAMEQQ